MKREEIEKLLSVQRAYYQSGRTMSLASRREALLKLKDMLRRREQEAMDALAADLGKSGTESYMCEIGLVYSEITWMLKHLSSLMARKYVHTPLHQAVAKSYVQPCPKGMVLIISPWNYPLMLTLQPLVDVLAAGNTAVLKLSAYAPRTTAFVASLVKECFDPGLVFVVTDEEEAHMLLDFRFDHILFTGSQKVGREVLRKAAEHLTPCTLELGGKSPCFVDHTADIALTARRIVFGKFLNCGQTCVAPDYILCEEPIREQLEEALIREIRRQFGEHPLENPNYGSIINEKHFNHMTELLKAKHPTLGGLLEGQHLRWGGSIDPERHRIEPTLLSPCGWSMPVMEQEIFGPILPILSYDYLDEAIEQIQRRPHPLALYVFSRDNDTIRKVTTEVEFGGGCINDVVIHLATGEMGFGGVGNSGMGAYHGRRGFEEFSHMKSMVEKKTWLDLPMRYQPYTRRNDRLIRFFMK